MCVYVEKKEKNNDTNWKRHLTACDVAKLKKSKTNKSTVFYDKKKEVLIMKCPHLNQIKVILLFYLAIKK